MTYRAWLTERALGQISGLPAPAFDTLIAVLARVCEDPYDPVFSVPAGSGGPRRRVAELAGAGFIVFVVDDAAELVRIFDLIWTG
ncbi:MAG: hypothetical protein ACLQDY_27035 [Streptosporangiaceae bacterium]